MTGIVGVTGTSATVTRPPAVARYSVDHHRFRHRSPLPVRAQRRRNDLRDGLESLHPLFVTAAGSSDVPPT